jgi:DNA-binding NarL/FixJ family response regulator
LVAAVHDYRKGQWPMERAQACEDAAALLATDGKRESSVELLEEARAVYVAAGATRDLVRVDAALRGCGVRRPRASKPLAAALGWESLTNAELAVVRLVAEGLTNREIGERLFVSRRTVETHLSHVFTKLDIRTRAQVASAATRHERA